MKLAFQMVMWALLSLEAAFGQLATSPSGTTNMAILQPAILSLQQTMDFVRVDKWKTSREVKAATAANMESIQRDVRTTLPGLVTAADSAPARLATILPLTRNVDALYDVVLRVTVIAESAASGEQARALDESLKGLESARRSLQDRAQQMAASDEAKAGDLQKQLDARPAIAPVCAPVTPPSKPIARKRKAKPKPATAN